MANAIKTIGVLTSGGDAPGMNAAIRAVVRSGIAKGLNVKGIYKGYNGLINGEIEDLTARSVSDTISRGGTMLYTARCAEMRTPEGQAQAAKVCRENGIEITGKKMTIAGSGGAATAIEITAALEGMREISIFARKDSFFANAEATVEKIRKHVPACTVNLFDLDDQEAFRKEVADSDIFTNATRVGMKPMDDQSLITDMSLFRKDLVVSDVVYNPRETKLLKDAAAAGCKTIPGIGMLLWQGAEAFKLYTGQEMPAQEVMDKYFAE